MSEETLTLGEALPLEIERVQEVIAIHEEVAREFGTPLIAVALMKNDIKIAQGNDGARLSNNDTDIQGIKRMENVTQYNLRRR